MIAIVDCGMGNPGSIANMYKRLGIKAEITRERDRIVAAERLILPGVGAFDHGMENLERIGLRALLDQRVLDDRVPVLGICLGMQLMTRRSEEGKRPGLGWIQADTVHFRTSSPASAEKLKFPHIGWNFVTSVRKHPLADDLREDPRFYFVHSYKVVCEDPADITLKAAYGDIVFTAAFARGNVAGVQFHPEKSHRFGMQLLKSFVSWDGGAAKTGNALQTYG